MDFHEAVKNWKIVVPTAASAIAAVLWFVGVESIRPVMAAEYTRDIQALNSQQLNLRREYLSEKITRVEERLFDTQLKIIELEQAGKAVPPELRQIEFLTKQQIEQLKKDEFSVHQQEIQLLRTE